MELLTHQELDIDPISHPAWTGGSQKVIDKGRISNKSKESKHRSLFSKYQYLLS